MNLWVEGTPFNSRHTHLLRSKRQYTHSPKEERGPLFLSIYVSTTEMLRIQLRSRDLSWASHWVKESGHSDWPSWATHLPVLEKEGPRD